MCTLQVDLRVPCDGSSYLMFLAIAIAVTVVFVSGLPTLLGYRFASNRRHIAVARHGQRAHSGMRFRVGACERAVALRAVIERAR
jgi:hypothetical protein